jgi:hypothetical protein
MANERSDKVVQTHESQVKTLQWRSDTGPAKLRPPESTRMHRAVVRRPFYTTHPQFYRILLTPVPSPVSLMRRAPFRERRAI